MSIPHTTPDLAEIRARIHSGNREGLYYAALLGFRTYSLRAVLERVREGFPYSAFVRFQRNTSLPMSVLSELTHIRPRTLTRRRTTGKFDRVESDRLLRASRVFVRALELFEGDVESARDWLTSKQQGLGGLAPLELAESEVGAKEVEDLIGRLEHGIPS